jgi:undecaprenyl pyrophosphate phosphatase UppP
MSANVGDVRLLAAVEPDQLKMGAIIAIVVLAVLALLVARFIQKLVLKLVMVLVLVGAGIFVYAQRDSLDECQRQVRAAPTLEDVSDPDARCTCEFVGYEVKVPGCSALPLPGRDSGG